MKIIFFLAFIFPIISIQYNICSICICTKYKINCHKKLINKKLTKNTFKNIKNPIVELILRENNLKILPKKLLYFLPHLQYIDLSFNKLESLPRNLFSKQIVLRKIDLSNNKIKMLPKNVFKNLILLDDLSISFNKLNEKTLENLNFKSNFNLKVFDVSTNYFKNFPKSFKNLLNVRYICSYHTYTKNVNVKIFKYLKHLENLELNENKIEIFNSNAYKYFKNLKILQLSMNYLQIIPENLNKFENLETLLISSNPGFYCLPNIFTKNLQKDIEYCSEFTNKKKAIFIGNLKDLNQLKKTSKNIKILIIQNNNLSTISNGIFNRFKNLEIISLSFNKIKTLENNVFKKNLKLKAINLCYNQLNKLPKKIFSKLKNINNLTLLGNNINYLDYSIFDQNRYLKILNFGYNKLKTLDSRIFEKNKKLETILLFNNQLKKIEKYILKNNLNLKFIDVTENFIKKIDKKLFRNTKIIEKIEFLNNLLTNESINGVFDNLKFLKMLQLNSNPGILCLDIKNSPRLHDFSPELCKQKKPLN